MGRRRDDPTSRRADEDEQRDGGDPALLDAVTEFLDTAFEEQPADPGRHERPE